MFPASLALLAWLPAIVGFGSLAPPEPEAGPLRRAGIAGFVGLALLAGAATALHLFVAISPWVSAAATVH